MSRTCALFRHLLPAAFFTCGFLLSSDVPGSPGPLPHSRSGAMEALEAWSAARAYPLPDIPPDRYLQEWESSRSAFRDLGTERNMGGIWEPIGPLNLQGRSRAVALNPLNPSTVYLGTASGGLWRSFTGTGGDWHQIRLGHPAPGISAIDINPLDTSVIYAGTGEVYRHQIALGGLIVRTTRGSYGIGILKTTDGGATWVKSLDWSLNQQRGVQRIIINPLNPSTVFAATTEGVYRTTDAGATWVQVLAVIMAQDIVLHQPDTTRLLVSCGNFSSPGAGVYRSTDAGNTWLQATGLPDFSGKTTFGAHRANNDIVYASVADSTTGDGVLFRTTDFGLTWTVRSSSSTNGIYGVQGWYSHYPAVHPVAPDIVLHNAVGLSRSTDGGTTFSTPLGGYADNHSYAIHPTLPDIIYGVNDDGIYRSTDFGSSWTNIGFGVQSGQFYAGFAVSATDSSLALVQSQDHIPGYRYLGSPSWDHDGAAVDEAGWTAIDQTNDNIQYAMTRFGGSIYRSLNRGDNFSFLASFGTAGAWNTPLLVSRSHPQVLYVGKQRVYKTTNGGTSWTATNGNLVLDNNPVLSMGMSATSPDTVYAGTGPNFTAAHVFRTTNGGTTWADVTGPLPDRYPLDIAVAPHDSRVAYVTYGGFGAGHVFRTTDAGATWTDVTGTLPDVPTGAVVLDPARPATVYVGNDIGVFVSTDAGQTWAGFSEGLPDGVITSDLVVSPSNGKLRIGTHGNGAWERPLYDGTSVPAFDYRPFAFLVPADGTAYLPGSAVGGFTASFRNSGAQAQSDSFDVQFRVLNGATPLYTDTRRIAGLGLAEQRTVAFGGSVVLNDTGTYIMEAIVLAGDLDPGNDTLRGTLDVIDPSIIHLSAVKVYAPYVPLTGGTPGPAGDDVQAAVGLPFPVLLDGRTYDSLLVSTNGWVEFGTGLRGGSDGLSLPADLGCCGANENGRLGTAQRPTKAVGVWWEDLNTDPPGSAVLTTTLGTAPAREFVVEWRSVRAYYDPGTTTRVSFQLRLREAGGMVLAYGPVLPGSFGGPDAGAMIGVKDRFGGDYRYYDIAARGTGRAGDVTTNLSPLTDWPGEDSAYVIGFAATVGVAVAEGWNLVSLPVIPPDRQVTAVFPAALPGTTYEYGSPGYIPRDSLETGKGYWMKFPASLTQDVTGGGLPSLTISVAAGWNLIGSVDHPAAAPSGGIVISHVFGYGNGYVPTGTLVPGRGYWVKASGPGSVVLGGVAQSLRRSAGPEDAVRIVIGDARGGAQTLLVFRDPADTLGPALFDLPPPPPEGVFSVRLADDRMAAHVGPAGGSIAADIRGGTPPYRLHVSGAGGAGVRVSSTGEGSAVRTMEVPEGASLRLEGFSAGRVIITVGAAREVPAANALLPNFPNPFNPVTTVRFLLRDRSRVLVRVFDIQGREAAVLVRAELPAGEHSAHWDARDAASGVYFVMLEADPAGGGTSFRAVRKMLFVK